MGDFLPFKNKIVVTPNEAYERKTALIKFTVTEMEIGVQRPNFRVPPIPVPEPKEVEKVVIYAPE
jgi:hypothetical protein